MFKTAMSALGQKQTFAVQKGMSALPPKADIHVCSVRPLKHFLNVAVRTTGRQLRSKTDSQGRQPRQLTLHRSCERPAH